MVRRKKFIDKKANVLKFHLVANRNAVEEAEQQIREEEGEDGDSKADGISNNIRNPSARFLLQLDPSSVSQSSSSSSSRSLLSSIPSDLLSSSHPLSSSLLPPDSSIADNPNFLPHEYDYEKHLKPITGMGVFIPAEAKKDRGKKGEEIVLRDNAKGKDKVGRGKNKMGGTAHADENKGEATISSSSITQMDNYDVEDDVSNDVRSHLPSFPDQSASDPLPHPEILQEVSTLQKRRAAARQPLIDPMKVAGKDFFTLLLDSEKAAQVAEGDELEDDFVLKAMGIKGANGTEDEGEEDEKGGIFPFFGNEEDIDVEYFEGGEGECEEFDEDGEVDDEVSAEIEAETHNEGGVGDDEDNEESSRADLQNDPRLRNALAAFYKAEKEMMIKEREERDKRSGKNPLDLSEGKESKSSGKKGTEKEEKIILKGILKDTHKKVNDDDEEEYDDEEDGEEEDEEELNEEDDEMLSAIMKTTTADDIVAALRAKRGQEQGKPNEDEKKSVSSGDRNIVVSDPQALLDRQVASALTEYDDEEIGDLMGEKFEEDTAGKASISEYMSIIDEFIEKKRRVQGKAKEGVEVTSLLSNVVNDEDEDENDEDISSVYGSSTEADSLWIEDPNVKSKLQRRLLRAMERMAEEDNLTAAELKEQLDSIYRKVKKKEEWDAESILSTYSNTENHPAVIESSSKRFNSLVKGVNVGGAAMNSNVAKSKIIKLSKKTGAPIGYVNHRDSHQGKQKSNATDSANDILSLQHQLDFQLKLDSSSSLRDTSSPSIANLSGQRPINESCAEKKARKAAVKTLQAAKRAQKKEVKGIYNNAINEERRLQVRMNANPAGMKL